MNLKDTFYNQSFIESLASTLDKEVAIDKKAFVRTIINKNWAEKELKERMRFITSTVHHFLPFDYTKQVDILYKIAPKYNDFAAMIFPDFIQIYGLDDFDISIKAMKFFTQHSSSEFAIRPFIERYPHETMQHLLKWSTHKNHHVRRLASEGARPRLPWAPPLREFIANPQPILPILENLKQDESEYVRKSVANHLNDISKDHPGLVLEITKQWHGNHKNTNWIVKHGLRTLLKKGNKKALSIFGLDNSKKLEVKDLSLSKKQIKIGDDVHFTFKISNTSNAERALRVEYKIDFVKANGSTSSNVFQLSEFRLKANGNKEFKRKQSFKDLSTRKHYPGQHKITISINGDEKSAVLLDLC